MKPASTFVLAPSERLAAIRKEKYTKPRGGRDVAYLVCDRLGKLELIGQKLPLLVAAINANVGGEPWARVSVNGLWESVDRSDGRVGPWCKGRWRVKSVELEKACQEYEGERAAHETAVIVAGQPSCYAICA
jgi:hypothetical protein